jgi:hypothetical protein
VQDAVRGVGVSAPERAKKNVGKRRTLQGRDTPLTVLLWAFLTFSCLIFVRTLAKSVPG